MKKTARDIRRKYHERLNKKQDTLFTVPALMGAVISGAETIDVSGRPGYVYVRMGDEEAIGQARCRTAKRYDLPCIVGFDGISTEFQVLRIRQDAYVAAGNEPIPEVDAHAQTHMWPAVDDSEADGSDLVYVHPRQMRGCRLSTSSSGSFYVECESGIIRTSTGWVWSSSASLDLSSSQPSVGARYVLVYFDSTGTLSSRNGDITTVGGISITDIPDTLVGEYATAAVLLWGSQEEIKDDGDRQDIIDLRFQQSSEGSEAHEILSSTHSDTSGSPSSGDVLTYSSTGKWIPRPPSGGGGSGGTTEAAIGPRWHADGPLAVVDEVDGVWTLTGDWRIETVYLYVETLGSASSTIIDIEKSTDDAATWTSIFPSGNPEIAHDNADNVITAAPPSAQILAAGTLLRCNIDQVASGARGMDVEIDGLYQEDLSSASLLPILGVG